MATSLLGHPCHLLPMTLQLKGKKENGEDDVHEYRNNKKGPKSGVVVAHRNFAISYLQATTTAYT